VLAAPDGMAGDGFGRSVAISGRTVGIGAQFDNGQALQLGSAYIFQIPEPSGWSLGICCAALLIISRLR